MRLTNKSHTVFLHRIVLSCLLLVLTFEGNAQIRIEISELPVSTPHDSKVYITGSFNHWNPQEESYRLQQSSKGAYFIDLPDSLQHFEYKFTRGSWETVEGDPYGKVRPNRMYDKATDGKEVRVAIESWEDFFQYTLVVSRLPTNTPHDAAIYVAGNFNSWNPGDITHRLTRAKDGVYQAIVYTKLDTIEYKFTRGTWASVEGRPNGKALPNRIAHRKEAKNIRIEAVIASWEDLSYPISMYDLMLAFSAFQGVLLIVALATIQDHNREANRLLILIIGVTSLALLSRVLPDYRAIFQAFPKLILLPELVLFLYAPLFYFYIQKLLTLQKPSSPKWYHYAPFVIVLLLYTPYFAMGKQPFIDKIVSRELSRLFSVIGGVALVINAYYWLVCRQIIRTYRQQYTRSHSFEQNLQYLNTVILIKGLCLLVWVFTCSSAIVGTLLEKDTLTLVEKSTDSIWLLFSTIPYFMGYFAIHQPEIFRLPQHVAFFKPVEVRSRPDAVAVPEKETIPEALPAEQPDLNIQPLQEKIETYMCKAKPHLNPRLTLHELAEQLEMSPHLLSRVINEGFGKNFFDLINSYRIEEFKRLVQTPSYEHYTLLSIAFEVGFNSKTAFNRSFKKLTNHTPSEYFYHIKGKSMST